MPDTQLSKVVALQQAVVRLEAANERLGGVPDWMRELHDEHAAGSREIEELEEAVEEADRERRAAEGGVTDEREKLEKYKKQLNTVQNQREYSALLAEIDTANRNIADFEAQELEALERREHASEELERRREAFRDLDERYEGEKERWDAEKPEVESEIARLERDIDGLRDELPRPVLLLFDRLNERLGRAVTEVAEAARPSGGSFHHCSACNYRVRPQAVETIRAERGIVQCDACKRILHIPSDAGAGEAEA